MVKFECVARSDKIIHILQFHRDHTPIFWLFINFYNVPICSHMIALNVHTHFQSTSLLTWETRPSSDGEAPLYFLLFFGAMLFYGVLWSRSAFEGTFCGYFWVLKKFLNCFWNENGWLCGGLFCNYFQIIYSAIIMHLWSLTFLWSYTLVCTLDIQSHHFLPTQALIEPNWECNLEKGHQMALKKVGMLMYD